MLGFLVGEVSLCTITSCIPVSNRLGLSSLKLGIRAQKWQHPAFATAMMFGDREERSLCLTIKENSAQPSAL
tara:strand:- start:265 stop:480 length:216 start_codon:yes stop_codon:yes gene_type:complete